MSDRDKSKEELILELNVLRQKYDSLKKSFDTSCISTDNQNSDSLLNDDWKIHALFEKGPIAVAYHKMIYDKAGESVDYFFLDANNQYVNLTGIDPRGKRATEAFPGIENDPSDWIGIFGKVAQAGGNIRFEQYLESNQRWYDCVALQYKQDHFVAAFLEITARKDAELALKKNEIKLGKMLSNIGDVIFIIDPNGITSFKSINLERIFGWKPEELVGKDKCEVVHPDDQGMVQGLMNMLREASGSHGSLECRYRCKNGTYKWVEVTVVNLLHDPDINGFLGNYHDISERKSFRENLVKLKEKAEESDRLKSAFLINMSHEIRTPLNGIIGFLDLLQGADLSGKQRDNFSEIIKKSSDRLLSTINDIITISKIESGQNELNISEFYVDELLNNLCGFFQPQAESKGLSFQYVDGSGEKVLSMSADKMKLESILSHFIKNAIKFTNKGFVEIGIKEKDGRIIFYVTDTGIGISKNKCESIFERFTQANMTHQREYEGSGLGLAISKSYAKMMDAEIWLESEYDKGSTFYLSLKSNSSLKNTLMDNQANTTLMKEEKRLVIVAEDDEVSFIYLREVLSRKNFQVIRAGNGEEAIQLLKNHPETDLVLMDLKMPVMDGWEATKQIRRFNINIPIIAQTAYATADETERMKLAGCNHYLTKPVDSDELMKCIGEYVA